MPPMASWTKKLNKVSQGDLQPGEELISAVFLQPSGTMGQAVGKGVGGVLGKAAASKMGGSQDGDADRSVTDPGIADTIGNNPSVIGLTNQRLLVYSYGSMSAKPKELKLHLPAADLVSVATEKQKATHRFVMNFSDGTAKAFEAPRLNNDPEAFANAVNAR